ncbi:DUF6549 family protein [Phocaeicola coprocola]|uniref:DUF6549 family protein n=1 Tax=Phocaeicola coprocola TaxID=310298 RepID=UPI00325B5F97
MIACFKDSTVYYNIRDSLAAVVHRIPKRKFLWWSWGTKGINWNWLILIPTQRLITMNL